MERNVGSGAIHVSESYPLVNLSPYYLVSEHPRPLLMVASESQMGLLVGPPVCACVWYVRAKKLLVN